MKTAIKALSCLNFFPFSSFSSFCMICFHYRIIFVSGGKMKKASYRLQSAPEIRNVLYDIRNSFILFYITIKFDEFLLLYPLSSFIHSEIRFNKIKNYIKHRFIFIRGMIKKMLNNNFRYNICSRDGKKKNQ